MAIEREKPVPDSARSEQAFLTLPVLSRYTAESTSIHRKSPTTAGIKVARPTFDKEVKPDELQTTWLGHAVGIRYGSTQISH